MDISFLANLSGWFQAIVATFGYLGIFFINLVGAASIIFPLPAIFVVFASGALLNPWLVALAASSGAAIGELTGYALGFGSGKVIETKYEKPMRRAVRMLNNNKPFYVIILFAVSPLPHDIIGILSGAARYDIRKFLLATFIGKMMLMSLIAWGGHFGIAVVLEYFAAG